MRTRFSVARCCCGPPVEPTCQLTADDFERADSTDLDTGSACGWTEQGGSTLAIVGGEVTGSGTAICDYVKGSLKGTIKLMGSVRFLATNGQVRVIYQWTDSSNYACVEWVHTATTLRGKVITRRGGGETTRATFELTHTRDSDELFDFCVTWDSVSSPNWQVKTMLASQTDATFALPGAVSFTFSPVIDETGVSGFYLNGNCYLESWELWKTSQDSILCTNCYGCHIGEVYDDFSSGNLISVNSPQFTGQWEQLMPGFDRGFFLAGGKLYSDTEGGNAYRCWKKDAFEGFSVLVQMTLSDFTVAPPDTIYFHLSQAMATYPIGFVMEQVSVFGVGMVWRWRAFRGASITTTTVTPAVGDVLKITAVKTATTDVYNLEWFINGASVRTSTGVTIDTWDNVTADNIWVGGYGQQEWDDFYFLSNATVE